MLARVKDLRNQKQSLLDSLLPSHLFPSEPGTLEETYRRLESETKLFEELSTDLFEYHPMAYEDRDADWLVSYGESVPRMRRGVNDSSE